jgi:hypothetical protein
MSEIGSLNCKPDAVKKQRLARLHALWPPTQWGVLRDYHVARLSFEQYADLPILFNRRAGARHLNG